MSPPEIPGQPLSKNILQVFLISCLDFSFSLLGEKEKIMFESKALRQL